MVRTGDRDLDLKVNMCRVMQRLEESILYNPTQWVVLQRIWSRRPTLAPDTTARDGHVPGEVATGAAQALQMPGTMALPPTPWTPPRANPHGRRPEDARARG